jgi:hypothetical protein
MLPRSFKAIVRLELECLTMISDEKEAWPLALQQLAKSYGGGLWISVDNLKHKDIRSIFKKALSGGLTQGVWSKLRESSG